MTGAELIVCLLASLLGVLILLAVLGLKVRNIRRGKRHQRASEAILDTDFWCDRHRAMVIRSGVDPIEATKALTIGLYMIGKPLNPIPQACCTFTDDTIRGVLARCSRKI